MTDRRRSVRRSAGEARWAAARLRPGRDVALVDIGEGGVLIETPARLFPGTRVVLQFIAPGGSVSVRGRVVRCEVTALDPSRGVRYRGAVSFDERQHGLGELATR
jgi:hypothetical protein